MKHILLFLFAVFVCNSGYSQSETIKWLVDGETFATTNCESGDDVILPTAPTKKGYTFAGWIGYTPIEYLESTGIQYIDTGYIPKAGTKIELRVIYLGGTMFAGSIDDSFGGPSYFGVGQYNNGFLYYFNSSNFNLPGAGISTYDVLTVSLEVDTSKTYATAILNNETKQQSNTFTKSGHFNSNASVGLFAGHYLSKSNVYRWEESSRIEMFYTKIWDNGVLVRDMIPVLDEAGTPCMFDRVSGDFFYNSGTGDFIAGPIITE